MTRLSFFTVELPRPCLLITTRWRSSIASAAQHWYRRIASGVFERTVTVLQKRRGVAFERIVDVMHHRIGIAV